MNDQIKIWTTIKPDVKSHLLMRATLLAALGLLPLFFGGVFLKPDFLEVWGSFLFGLGLLLIIGGFYPYSRILILERNPSLLICSKDYVVYTRNSEAIIEIPKDCLHALEYVENASSYGIGIRLVSNPAKKIKIFQRRPDFIYFDKKGFDLFLPYFSKKAELELKEIYFTAPTE